MQVSLLAWQSRGQKKNPLNLFHTDGFEYPLKLPEIAGSYEFRTVIRLDRCTNLITT